MAGAGHYFGLGGQPMRSADATRGCAGGGGPRAVCAPSAARAGRSGDPRHIAVPAWSRMFARSALVCGMETGKKCSSWNVGSRSIFNLLVRMDGSFGEENCGIKKKKRHFSVHRLLHLSVSGALQSENKSQYLNNGLDFINDFSP